MTVQSFSAKQPYEKYYVSFNFSRVIPSGVEILSTAVTAVDAQGADATATIINNTLLTGDCKVHVCVKGGTVQTYKITCKIVCDNDEKYELDGYLPVVEE